MTDDEYPENFLPERLFSNIPFEYEGLQEGFEVDYEADFEKDYYHAYSYQNETYTKKEALELDDGAEWMCGLVEELQRSLPSVDDPKVNFGYTAKGFRKEGLSTSFTYDGDEYELTVKRIRGSEEPEDETR